jgi:hypothetical protein
LEVHARQCPRFHDIFCILYSLAVASMDWIITTNRKAEVLKFEVATWLEVSGTQMTD